MHDDYQWPTIDNVPTYVPATSSTFHFCRKNTTSEGLNMEVTTSGNYDF